MSGALTYREGRAHGYDPVELFFDNAGFLLGCGLEEVGLDIVIDLFFAQWTHCSSAAPPGKRGRKSPASLSRK